MIILAYNEEESLETTLDELLRVALGVDYLVVNDGSKDAIEQICHDRGFNHVTLPVNIGLTVGFQTGMKYALRNDYDCALQFDADGQHRPEYIARMRRGCREGGCRYCDWIALP